MLKNLVDGLNAIRQPSDRLQIFSNTRWPICGSQAGVDWINGWGTGNRFILEWKAMRRAAGALDAMLFTNYFTPPARAAKHLRLVTVIHDLQYLHFPQNFTLQKRLWLRCAHELTLRRADRVVVISDFVRQDLLSHYGARWENKVQVIPNPISFERFDGETPHETARPWDKDVERGRYILSVAAHYPHKNLATLIRAFAQLRRRKGFNRTGKRPAPAHRGIGTGRFGDGHWTRFGRRTREVVPARRRLRFSLLVRGLRDARRRGIGVRLTRPYHEVRLPTGGYASVGALRGRSPKCIGMDRYDGRYPHSDSDLQTSPPRRSAHPPSVYAQPNRQSLLRGAHWCAPSRQRPGR